MKKKKIKKELTMEEKHKKFNQTTENLNYDVELTYDNMKELLTKDMYNENMKTFIISFLIKKELEKVDPNKALDELTNILTSDNMSEIINDFLSKEMSFEEFKKFMYDTLGFSEKSKKNIMEFFDYEHKNGTSTMEIGLKFLKKLESM